MQNTLKTYLLVKKYQTYQAQKSKKDVTIPIKSKIIFKNWYIKFLLSPKFPQICQIWICKISRCKKWSKFITKCKKYMSVWMDGTLFLAKIIVCTSTYSLSHIRLRTKSLAHVIF